MIYLSGFHFPSAEQENEHFNMFTPTYYTSLYPFRFHSGKGLMSVNFSDITIFAGSNGSGKSTVLNIISSHSPFMLATPFAKIYDMDSKPVSTTKWTDIPSVRTYHDFFEVHAGEFRKD